MDCETLVSNRAMYRIAGKRRLPPRDRSDLSKTFCNIHPKPGYAEVRQEYRAMRRFFRNTGLCRSFVGISGYTEISLQEELAIQNCMRNIGVYVDISVD
jgi:hypothetical protein